MYAGEWKIDTYRIIKQRKSKQKMHKLYSFEFWNSMNFYIYDLVYFAFVALFISQIFLFIFLWKYM